MQDNPFPRNSCIKHSKGNQTCTSELMTSSELLSC